MQLRGTTPTPLFQNRGARNVDVDFLYSTHKTATLKKILIGPFGLKCCRLLEWATVVREAGNRVGVKGWLKMVKAAWGVVRVPVDRTKWRQRLRICAKCPIYDKQLKRCGPWTGSPYGCQCYVPYMAMEDGGPCWARQRDADSGWE